MNVKYFIDAETSLTWGGANDVNIRGWKMAGIREGIDWIIAERAKSITRLNLYTHNSNRYGVQKYFLYIFYVRIYRLNWALLRGIS